MTWGSYYFFYECPLCGKKYRWGTEDISSSNFSQCPDCKVAGNMVGETKDIKQGENKFVDYEYI